MKTIERAANMIAYHTDNSTREGQEKSDAILDSLTTSEKKQVIDKIQENVSYFTDINGNDIDIANKRYWCSEREHRIEDEMEFPPIHPKTSEEWKEYFGSAIEAQENFKHASLEYDKKCNVLFVRTGLMPGYAGCSYKIMEEDYMKKNELEIEFNKAKEKAYAAFCFFTPNIKSQELKVDWQFIRKNFKHLVLQGNNPSFSLKVLPDLGAIIFTEGVYYDNRLESDDNHTYDAQFITFKELQNIVESSIKESEKYIQDLRGLINNQN